MRESSAEKTELPTPKRLREAREKGQVACSKEVVATMLLGGLFVWIAFMFDRFCIDFRELCTAVGAAETAEFNIALRQIGFKVLRMFAYYTLMCCAVAAVLAIVFHLVQTGFLFTFAPLKPDVTRLLPATGWRRICSLHNLFEGFKQLVKTLFLSALICFLIRAALPSLPFLCQHACDALLPVLQLLFKRLALYTFSGCALIAIADWFFQKRHHLRSLMMTKSEVRREYKEMEVSQEVRRVRSELAREWLQAPALREGVRRASVIVTNPTHIAIGIRYVREETPIPQVTVSGVDRVAAVIRQLAREEGVPMMEHVPLARALYARTHVEDYIPESLLEPVAEVLKWVQELEAEQREAEALARVQL